MISVFFATIAAGGGHVATAMPRMHRLHPGGVNTQVADVMAEFGFEELDRRHKESWREMLKRPRLVRLGQRLMDAAPGLTRAAQNSLNDFAKAAQQRIDALGPTRRCQPRVARHGPDAGAHQARHALACWFSPPSLRRQRCGGAQGRVGRGPSAAAMRTWSGSACPKRVAVVGYPVRQCSGATRPTLRPLELGLADAFTCLLSLGAEGLAGEALQLAESLARATCRWWR